MMDNEEKTDQMRDEEAAFGRSRRLRIWSIIYVAVAVSLWAQWLAPGVLAEVRSEDGSEAALALQSLPFFAAALGVLWRHRAILLGLVPVSFLPGLAVMSDVELTSLATPGSLLLGLATFALYLVVAAQVPDWKPEPTARDGGWCADGLGDEYGEIFRRFVVARFVAMGLIFAVITYALFFDAGTAAALAALEGDRAIDNHHTFMVVLVYFAWTIAVYVGAVLPVLNWEHHRRRSGMPAGQRRLLNEPRRLVRRVFFWLAGLFVVTSLSMIYLF